MSTIELISSPVRPSGDGAEGLERRGAAAAWAMVIAAYLLQATMIIRASGAWVVDRVPDDAFYYLEVARHLGRGDGPTFDGINQTNGFHPLWQALLTPLTWVFRDDIALTKAAMLLGLVLGLGAVVMLARLLQDVVGPAGAAVGALVAVHGGNAMAWQTNGMESSAVVFMLVVVAWSIRGFDLRRSPRSALLVGLACGGLVLARIDFGPVLLLVPLALVVRVRAIAPAMWWLVGGGLIVAPVALLSLVTFGEVLTVSGSLKLAWMADIAEHRWGGRRSVGYVGFVVRSGVDYVDALVTDAGETAFAGARGLGGRIGGSLLVVLGVAGAIWSWRTRVGTRFAAWSPSSFAVVTVGAVVAAKAIVDVCVLPVWAMSWYAAPARLFFAFAVGVGAWRLVQLMAARHSAAAGAGAAVVVLLAAVPLGAWAPGADDHDGGDSWRATLDEAAAWVIESGPPGVYGAYDAGILGFRLDGHRTLVNLDGLVNDYEHADLLMSGASTEQLLAHNDVDFLVQRMEEQAVNELACAIPVWRSPSPVHSPGLTGDDPHLAYVHILDTRACTG